MSAKHTPGPYHLVADAHGIRGKCMVMAGQNYEIAVVKMQRTIAVTEATGRLLSAAPDLLQAAKDSLEYMDAAVGDLTLSGLDGSDVIIEALNDLRERVAVAIAKAEGGGE